MITIVPLIAYSLYIRNLGDRTWGVISLVLMLQSILSLSEAGISQLAARFLSRIDKTNESDTLLFHAYERIYFTISRTLCVSIIVITGIIAAYGLSGSYSQSEMLTVGVASGLLFLFAFPASLYRLALMQTGQQLTYNLIASTATLLRHGGLSVLVVQGGKLASFAGVLIISTGIETIIRRQVCLRGLKKTGSRIQPEDVRKVLSEAKIVMPTILIGTITSQADKLFVSVIAAPTVIGSYNLATTIAQASSVLSQPVINTLTPVILREQRPSLTRKLAAKKLFTLLLSMNTVMAIVFWATAEPIVTRWTGSETMSREIVRFSVPLLIGAMCNTLYHVAYYGLLSDKLYDSIRRINNLGFIFAIAVVPILITWFGQAAIPLAYAIPNVIALLLSLNQLAKEIH